MTINGHLMKIKRIKLDHKKHKLFLMSYYMYYTIMYC